MNKVEVIMGLFVILSLVLFGVWLIKLAITGDPSNYPGGQNRYFDHLDY